MIIKDTILPNVDFYKNNCKSVQWFILAKSFMNASKGIMVGNIYIPPAESRYYNDNSFD